MKIWLNQAFSMRNVVRRIVMDRPNVELCVSAIDKDSTVRDVAPAFWTEPARGPAITLLGCWKLPWKIGSMFW
jgi:hypothetical protein